MKIKGVIFDMDGVVTQTAQLHYKTWKVVLDQFLHKITSNSYHFTEQDYFYFFDGVPRKDGVKNYFSTLKIGEKEVKKHYEDLAQCIDVICSKKNNLMLSVIAEDKIQAFNDCMEFIEFIRSLDYKIAIISSSKNCRAILKSAGIENLFAVCVDGVIAEEKQLVGKPNPAIFLEAAKQLNLLPEQCLVIEDALAGVKAAKDGGFNTVALDRENKLFEEFRKYNPDYILRDLSKNQVQFYKNFILQKSKAASALDALPFIASSLNQQKEIVLFLDYDGTLTPIVDRPQDASLSPLMRESILCLCKNYLTVIISGRELTNLKEQVKIPNIFYAGNHGFELVGPENSNFSFKIGDDYLEDIQAIYKEIYLVFKEIPGCIIENKKFTLSIHYRLAHESQYEFISATIDRLLMNFKNLSRHEGKMVIEIRPRIAWNKGIAALSLLKWLKKDYLNVIPIYIGDDITDEDAFQQFNQKGITIKVGSDTHTNAHFFLKTPQHVKHFLDQLNRFKE
jgi:trehalose-phosphatase